MVGPFAPLRQVPHDGRQPAHVHQRVGMLMVQQKRGERPARGEALLGSLGPLRLLAEPVSDRQERHAT